MTGSNNYYNLYIKKSKFKSNYYRKLGYNNPESIWGCLIIKMRLLTTTVRKLTGQFSLSQNLEFLFYFIYTIIFSLIMKRKKKKVI